MNFTIWYILTDDRAVTLGELEEALRQVDPTYAIDHGLVRLGEAKYALIHVAQRGDAICDQYFPLLTSFAAKKQCRAEIVAAVEQTKALVQIEPVVECRSNEGLPGVTGVKILDARMDEVLAPLGDWLLTNRTGLLAWASGQFFNQAGELK